MTGGLACSGAGFLPVPEPEKRSGDPRPPRLPPFTNQAFVRFRTVKSPKDRVALGLDLASSAAPGRSPGLRRPLAAGRRSTARRRRDPGRLPPTEPWLL